MTQAKGTVHLGFEVGTGDPVAIPLRHLAVTGQTQEAGKTTTLEALIARSQLRAVTFITKRGEGSFKGSRRIAPYFREQTDWQFVASILEASRGEKLKFERAWIIRASKGARNLADVQANVQRALADPKTRGMSADVYLVLDAYLEVVVPQIASVKWSPTLDLAPGVNAVDLGELAIEMQHLVIRSTINWVLEREKGTVVVVPEAWKFIPQGRGTPVKLAAESFIRQGAALQNYLWLDSQDLGGIEKSILRSVPVWLLGVQREANEIKRTLDNIPASTAKPKAADIARLRLGEFYACWGEHAIKTYVQPSWLSDAEAKATATGKGSVSPQRAKEGPEMCELHQKLERELADAKRELEQSRKAGHSATEACARAEKRAAAADELRQVLGRFLPAGAGVGAAVDEDAIVARVLDRVPTGGGGPIQVTPPEKLRKDFQREESARIVAAAKELRPLQKKVLKLVEGVATNGEYISQRMIAERLGRATGGQSWMDLGKATKELAALGFVAVAERQGVRRNLKAQIATDLEAYKATPDEVEAVYQSVLFEVATEAAA